MLAGHIDDPQERQLIKIRSRNRIKSQSCGSVFHQNRRVRNAIAAFHSRSAASLCPCL